MMQLTENTARMVRLPVTLLRETESHPESQLMVDLSALQTVGIVDVEGLPFGVEVERSETGFAVAVARILGPAKWQMGLRADCRSIHIDDPGFKIAQSLEGFVHIPRVNSSRQTVLYVVGDLQSIFEIVKWNHANDRPEDFFLADAHHRITIGEDCRFMEPAAGVRSGFQAMSSCGEFRSFCLSNFDVAHHGFELLLVDAWPHLGCRVEAVADFQRLHALDKFLHE